MLTMALPFNPVLCPIDALGAGVNGGGDSSSCHRPYGQKEGRSTPRRHREDRAKSADRCGRDARILYEFRGAAHTAAAKEVA